MDRKLSPDGEITGDHGEEDACDRGRLKEAFIEVLT
jgi:hypothetical protein